MSSREREAEQRRMAQARHPARRQSTESDRSPAVSRLSRDVSGSDEAARLDLSAEQLEAEALTVGGAEAAALHDGVIQLREIVIGHRNALVAAGFCEEAADEMASDLHEVLLPEYVT